MRKSLQFFSTLASFGLGIGIIVFIFGLFASDSIFTAIGAGVAVSSIVLLIFGISLSLMEDHTAEYQKESSPKSDKSF